MKTGWYLIVFLVAFISQNVIAQDQKPLKVGSKRFTESYILGELITQRANTVGSAKHKAGLGNTAIVLAALQSGAIDVYPEYTGTIAREILKEPDLITLEDLAEPLRKLGLGIAVPLGFNNGYALVVTERTALSLKIFDLSDLRKQANLQLGLSAEFLQRPDGWPTITKQYELDHLTPRAMDHGLAYDALKSGLIEGTDAYTTDARIVSDHLVLLKDSRHVLPPYSAILLFRLNVPFLHPKEWGAISGLQNLISEDLMRQANARVDLQHLSPSESADILMRDLFQKSASLDSRPSDSRPSDSRPSDSRPSDSRPSAHIKTTEQQTEERNLWGRSFKFMFSSEEARLVLQHFLLVVGPVFAASILGIPLGIVAATFPRAGRMILGMTGLLQTIPALALLALLIALSGQIGTLPAVITLFFYAMLPIVESTQAAFQGIDRHLRESAISLGASWLQRTIYVELPVAQIGILSGVRTAAIINVGGATLAAFVGAGGLGERIVGGLAVNDPALLIAGAVPSALMALVIQYLASCLEGYWRKQLGV